MISDNVFTGIHGKTGEARGAIFMWHNATDCVIERNIIIDCDTGICLGNSSARGERRHANGFLVRNNFVVRCPESNILADHTRDCRILNNTVHDPEDPHWPVAPRRPRQRRAGRGEQHLQRPADRHRTVRRQDRPAKQPDSPGRRLFRRRRPHGDLHLTAKAVDAIDQATSNRDVSDDIDRQPRGGKPDLGADERAPATQ